MDNDRKNGKLSDLNSFECIKANQNISTDNSSFTETGSIHKFFQFSSCFHSGIGRSPYEALYAVKCRDGLNNLLVSITNIKSIRTEEELETLLSSSNDTEDKVKENSHPLNNFVPDEKSTVTEDEMAAQQLSDKMETLEVIPDVIDKKPNTVLHVTYNKDIKVNEGNVITPTNVKDRPVVYWNSEDDSFYSLVMTDPDAPSRENPELREWHHWLVVNIPGNNIQQGETLSEYIGAGPLQDTGLHRYVFLLYKQPQKISFNEEKLTNCSADGRGNFCVKDFANKYHLGDPVAGKFFKENSVDSLTLINKITPEEVISHEHKKRSNKDENSDECTQMLIVQLGEVKKVSGLCSKDEERAIVFGDHNTDDYKVKCKQPLHEFSDRISTSVATMGNIDTTKLE
ncbi:hypothetical protein RN001_007952 [Aquatica leii]|uniref:Phosphatidylethanolamine-binding protein n=1 Tax=Aquatica leii TaxID=1421715 RepID=A0AAN7PCP7_9COLE|nr:hypothetical protein RN001_007952 [Aquatica leii]